MKAKVYHYDMTDRDLVVALCFKPTVDAVAKAWDAGRYTLVYEVEVDTRLSVTAQLESVFQVTQDTGTARSTSVGDIVEIDGKRHLVSAIGFKSI